MNGRERQRRTASPCESMPALLALLGGGVRYELLTTLAQRSQTVTSLADDIDLARPHVSHNLSLLFENALVETKQVKKFRWYRLSHRVHARITGKKLILRVTAANGDELIIRTSMQDQAGSSEYGRTGA